MAGRDARKQAIVLAVCLGTAWAARAEIPGEDVQHDFVQAREIGAEGVGKTDLEIQLQAKGGIAAGVDAFSLLFYRIQEHCPGGCQADCVPLRYNHGPVLFPADKGIGPPAMGLLRVIRGPDESAEVHVALAQPNGTLYRQSYSLAPGSRAVRLLSSQALPLGSAWVLAFADLEEVFPQAGRRGFLAFGKGGRMSRFEEGPAGLTETVLATGVSVDLTASAGGWVGSAAGHFFRLIDPVQAPHLLLQGEPTHPSPILHMTSRVARVRDGFYLLQGGRWSAFRPVQGRFQGVHPIPTATGTRVRIHLFPGSRMEEFADSVTTLEYRAGNAAWSPPPAEAIAVDGTLPLVYNVAFRDVDRNIDAVAIRLLHPEGGESLFEGVPADPQAGCARSGQCLPGEETVLKLRLREDSVSLAVEVVAGERVAEDGCATGRFAGVSAVHQAAARWGDGSRLEVRAGGRTLAFRRGPPLGIAGAGPARKGISQITRVPGRPGTILVEGPDGTGYGLTGRAVRARGTSTFPLPAAP